VVVAGLIGAGLLVGGSGGARKASVAVVSMRVQELRGLRFVRAATVRVVSARRMGSVIARYLPAPRDVGPSASDFVRRVPVAELPIIERLEALELLGAVPVGTTLKTLIFGGETDPGGLFDPRSGVIYLRSPSAAAGGQEDVLAHELTHALEHQNHLGPTSSTTRVDFDAREASRALVEGPATLLMFLYGKRYLGFRGGLEQFLASLSAGAGRELRLPPFLLAEALFPYLEGARYVNRALTAGGAWSAVTAAERRPPGSTQQILTGHDAGQTAPRFALQSTLGRAWRAEPPIDLGAYDTAVLLTPGMLRPLHWIFDAWRGGSMQLWQNLNASRLRTCRRPCGAHYILLVSWRWSTPSAAQLIAPQLTTYLTRQRALDANHGGPPQTRLGSMNAIASGRTTTTLILSPRQTITNRIKRAIEQQSH
jgi:hypothetical protein